jgi:putative membrane protein
MKTQLAPLVATLVALGFLGRVLAGQTGQTSERLTQEQFIAGALARGVAEEKLAERAAKHAQSKEVRDYAQHLVNDHTRANKQLMDVAKDMKIAVVQGFDPESKKIHERFTRLEGAAFDRAFVDHMAQAHKSDIGRYEYQAKNATNARLRTVAGELLPTLRQHLKEAKQIQEHLKTSK